VTIGSLEGVGTVNLGANNLTVGSDNQGNSQSKTFSGVIQDNGAGGSLTKLGRRRLVLAMSNAYSGGTTIEGGELFVSNKRGSATGRGPVNVAAGRLGGTGIIAGPVTVGASRVGAELAPGDEGAMGTLTLLKTLTFRSRGSYLFDINSNDATSDQLIANGVTIKPPNAELFITDLAGGILKNAELYDVDTGTWSTTNSLGVARAGHTATLLPNGMVLVAGGTVDGSGLSELYDPASGTWANTGSLTTPRGGQTATLLPSGKVLIAGGSLGFGPTASAELYDPASGTWTPTGNMTTARDFHTATLLGNGKVLVVGGPGISTAELYDPANGNWSLTANPITSRWSHTATLLPDGEVLVAGGSTGIGSPTNLAELYDPATQTWTATSNLRKARQVHTATLLADGKVLVAGGQQPHIIESTSAELYDPVSGTWAFTGSLAVPRAYHTAALLQGGRVMAAGGNNGINFMEPSVELYDPASGTWTMTGSLHPGRYSHSETLLPDGSVLIAGGVGQGLPIGTVLTVINNTSANPISGTFPNLPDQSIVIVANTKCQVNYSGGDGNDLTLTAIQ
jgi:autotransporter-associated beta strand protein